MFLLHKKTIIFIIVIVLAWLTLGCQSISEIASLGGGTPVALDDWPHSTFSPLRESAAVGLGESLHLESHHISPAGFGKLELFVDDEPVNGESLSEQAAVFSYKGVVQILVEARHGGANAVQPEFPNSDWTVTLIWLSQAPGTYDLTLVATDRAGRPAEPITQRIEVIE